MEPISLAEIKNKSRKFETLIEGSLWISYTWNAWEADENLNNAWLKWECYEFSEGNSSDTLVDLFAKGEGPTGALRELRHTYFGEDGYAFYLNATHMRALLTELEKYYDLS